MDVSDLHFINLGWCTACHLGKDEPSNDHRNTTGSCEAVPKEIKVKICLQRMVLGSGMTYKKPVLTPQLDTGLLLIMSGVQKLNIVASALEEASAQPAVFARRRC
jgi:hypothetical protein